MPHLRASVLAALSFYAVWVAATWFFEGRIETLLRPDAVADRAVYAFVVNLLLGLGGSIVMLRRGEAGPDRHGLQWRRRTPLAVAAGALLGLAAYVLQGAPSRDPLVVGNAFAQVFVVSAAEVVVCWALVGSATEAALQRIGPHAATVAAAVIASVLFGVYHIGHSAPFNSASMIVLLSVVGLVTGAFFLVSRDVLGTVVFHNFLGTFGVVKALVAAGAVQPLQHWQPALLLTAALTVAVLVAGAAVLSRRTAARPRGAPPGTP